MRIRGIVAGGGVVLVMALALVGCGVSVSNMPADGDETPASTVTIPVITPGKGATAVTNLTIATDRSSYAPGDEIHATATNSSGKTVYASDGKTSCSIFALEMKTGEGWQVTQLAACANPSKDPVQLATGAAHSATIKALSGSNFPSGTYRLALSFSTFNVPPPLAVAPHEGGQLATSRVPFDFRRAAATQSPLSTVYSPAFEIR